MDDEQRILRLERIVKELIYVLNSQLGQDLDCKDALEDVPHYDMFQNKIKFFNGE